MPTTAPRLITIAALAVACVCLVPAAPVTAQEAPPAATPAPAQVAAGEDDGGGFGEGALVGVIGAVVGAVVTAGLAAAWAIYQERAHGKRQRAGVRALLRIEVEENLAALRPYWEAITEDLGNTTTAAKARGTYARGMVQRPLPPWSRLMWEAQAASLSAALTPQEISAMQRHYTNLAALGTYRERLVAVDHADTLAEQTAVEVPSPIRGMAPSRMPVNRQYYEVAGRLWPDIERAATELLEQDVPLGPD